MTLGSGKLQIAQPIAPELNAFVTPSQLIASARKGKATTPEATANVSGGVGPYTFSWSVDDARVTITDSENEKTKFSAAGFDEMILTKATVTATDTGNGDAEVTATTDLSFEFGIFGTL